MTTPDLSGNGLQMSSYLRAFADGRQKIETQENSALLPNLIAFMFCRRSFNMAARLRSRKYSLMKGVKLSRLVNKNQLQLVIHLLSQSFKSNLVPRQLFTSVFGVGPKTAEKWYRRGLRSFSDVLAQPGIHLNRMQQSGMSKFFPRLQKTTSQIIDQGIQYKLASKKHSAA